MEDKNKRREDQGNDQSGHYGEAAGERHGLIVDFTVAGIVDETDAETPFSPERQREQRNEKRAEKCGRVNECESHAGEFCLWERSVAKFKYRAAS